MSSVDSMKKKESTKSAQFDETSVAQPTFSKESNDTSSADSQDVTIIKSYEEVQWFPSLSPPTSQLTIDSNAFTTEASTNQIVPLTRETSITKDDQASEDRQFDIHKRENNQTLIADANVIIPETNLGQASSYSRLATTKERTPPIMAANSEKQSLQRQYHEMPVHCRKCNTVLSYHDILIRELIRIEYPRTDPTKIAEYKFRCMVCSEVRPRKYLLYQHLSNHAKSKMFLCSRCVSEEADKEDCGIVDSSGKCFRTVSIKPPDAIKCSRCQECIYRPDISMLKSMKKEKLKSGSTYQSFSCDQCKHSVSCTPLAITHSTRHIEKGDVLCYKCLKESMI